MDNFTDVGLEDSKKFFRPLKVSTIFFLGSLWSAIGVAQAG